MGRTAVCTILTSDTDVYTPGVQPQQNQLPGFTHQRAVVMCSMSTSHVLPEMRKQKKKTETALGTFWRIFGMHML
ncbi:hypothetical protein AGOR_G00078750 [Albula goreensis]|uniref:Uncharacterized protein n=1 Tax=Albula goreensis TaxID=1534307 RepID=A0A8T3DT13_9TELE|nr:hypothetical protein AGOR_G00078750 [Albula goreensis]